MTDYLRVSDAERHEVGELLSRHYLDGRLDADELDERLGEAMRAKTRGDLSRLLVDLPRLHPRPMAVPPTPRRWGVRAAVIAIALSFLVPASLVALAHSAQSGPWDHPGPVLLPYIRYPDTPAVQVPGTITTPAPPAVPGPPSSTTP